MRSRPQGAQPCVPEGVLELHELGVVAVGVAEAVGVGVAVGAAPGRIS